MLKEKVTKGKEFVKEHKKEIAIGLACVVGGAVVYKITKKAPKFEKLEDCELIGSVTVDIPQLKIGKIDDLWCDDFGKNLIVNDITVANMGEIGQEFLKIDGVTEDTVVTGVIGLLNK